MGYLASSPEFRAYEENVFVAVGGEKILPFRPADGFILVKNRQIQYPTVDWFINTDGKAELKTAATVGDTFLIINLASFLISSCATKEEITEASNKPKFPLFDLTWRPSRASILDGTVPADGDTYSREAYPDAFAAIQAGLVPVCTDAEWLADPAKHGFYTLGDGSTTFRVPDYNGKKTDAIASVVLRGDGKNAGSFGQIQQDAMRKITGKGGVVYRAATIQSEGAIGIGPYGSTPAKIGVSGGDPGDNAIVSFDNSLVTPVANENRMTNVAGVWCIRLFNGRVLDGNIDLAALQNKITNIESNQKPVLATEWVSLRTAMWNGYGPADGQLLSRALYPSAFKAIQLGLVPVCSDADWLADPTKRGCFTLGDGSTTFRLPDYNGKYEGSLGAPVLRGDGKNAPSNGAIQKDCIRDIQGLAIPKNSAGMWTLVGDFSGALYPATENAPILDYSGTTVTSTGGIRFAASRVVPTGPENRMVNVGGCWAVKLFGYINELPLADSARLATEISSIASRVSNLEARTSTCLVNATGTGAPHETVVSELPANIVPGRKYVIPNPFGNNTPVRCWAEILVNGRWSETGWIYLGPNAAYGTKAVYSQGRGIVVVTATAYLAGGDHDLGSDLGNLAAISTAPCRVFVSKI